MKKILTILVVALLTASTVFAQVNLSGQLVAGFDVRLYDENGFNTATSIYGQDGTGKGTTRLNLTIADDSGVWSGSIDGFLTSEGDQRYFWQQFNSSGKMMGKVTVNLDKIYANATGNELPISLSIGIGANTQQTGLRAYTNKSGQNYDRVRTLSKGYYVRVAAGYKDFIDLAVDYDPVVNKDVAVSALIAPVDGIKVSAAWALKGENRTSDHGFVTSTSANKGLFGAAANVDISKLANLDFTIGASVAYRFEYDAKYHMIAAEVYGGNDKVTAYAEYAFKNYDSVTQHSLIVGVDLSKLTKAASIDLYFGSKNLSDFENTWCAGGNLGYTLSNVKFNLGLEYTGGNAASAKTFSKNYDGYGFHIVPSVTVSF